MKPEVLYHTSLPDQYLNPEEAIRANQELSKIADKKQKRIKEQLRPLQDLSVNATTVRQQACLRHLHSRVDRSLVYSIVLSDHDRSGGLVPLHRALQPPITACEPEYDMGPVEDGGGEHFGVGEIDADVAQMMPNDVAPQPRRIYFRLVETKSAGKFIRLPPAAGVSRLAQRDMVVAVLEQVGGDADAPKLNMQPIMSEVFRGIGVGLCFGFRMVCFRGIGVLPLRASVLVFVSKSTPPAPTKKRKK